MPSGHRKDGYANRARKAGFRARSVFKLEDLDEDFHLLAPGMRILDLGCCPGSWMQYCVARTGSSGAVVGIDRTAPNPPIAGTQVLVGSVFDVPATSYLAYCNQFDCVLSDMAPDTTGIRHVDQARSEALFERALDIACEVLAPGGSFVGKLFQGPEFKALYERTRARFTTAKIAKPTASRTVSIEQYVVGKGFR